MIRDRLKKAARKVALKAFGMEWDAEDRAPQAERPRAGAHEYDPSVIPRIQEGSGDTPGPNHKTLVGRTYLAAQVVAGAPELIIDIRPPEEWRAGHIPGAVLLPGHQLLDREDLFPAQDQRISIYDATGEQRAMSLAEAMRERGWRYARALEGGWAHWIEHDEPTTLPPEASDAKADLGDPVELEDGRRGVIQAVRAGPDGYVFDVLIDFQKDDVAKDVPEVRIKP